MRLGDAAWLVLLVAAAWVAGLAIVILFTIEQHGRPAVHAGVSAAPYHQVIATGRPGDDRGHGYSAVTSLLRVPEVEPMVSLRTATR